MSVTQYEIPCAYDLLKLKDTVFFLSKNSLKTISIDNGEAYATFVNPSPYPPSPNRLKGFNVKLTETESLDERYRFTKQLTMSIHGHLTDSRFLMDDDYYIVVQTEDGTYYLVNVDFPSKMTYTYNLSQGQNQTDFTFTSNSNHPTLKLNWNPVTWNTCQTYQVYGIDGLKLLEKDYTTIDAEQGVINLFDGNELKQVDYLKNTISLQEAYDGELTTTTISFEIPFNNYKPSWQYNLLEFDQNLYVAHITPKNSESGIFCGYEHGLQPQYEINGSTSDGESTTIKITLVEASNWGLFEFDTWSYYRDSTHRWVGIDSEVKCIGLGVGINTLMQEVDGNGTPTQRYKCLEGYESEYTNYNIITSYTESDVESFRTSVCARFRTRGAAPTGLYTCINGDKYELIVTSISYDGGKAWVNSDDYTVGEMVESASSFCEIEPQYKWEISDKWDCISQLERWIPSGYTCINGNKYQNNIKQVSTDGGETWTVVIPEEYSASTLIESDSYDCGYRTSATTSATYCSNANQYVDVYSLVSRDYGVTWSTASTSTELIEEDVVECGFSARTISTATTCVGVDKHYLDEYQESTDYGRTWTTISSSTGSLIESNSYDCGYRTGTTSGDPYCQGYDKYVDVYYRTSTDGGTTWVTASTTPTLVEAQSEDCGYIPPTPTPTQYRWTQSGTTCIGYDKYQNNIKEQSTDGGETWTVVIPEEYSASTLIEADSQDCGYVPPTPTIDGKFKLTLSDSTTVTAECDATSAITSEEVTTQYGGTVVSAEIGNCVTSIGWGAFYECSGLTSIDIPNSVTSIDDWAFANCRGLTSCTIGSGVTSIGDWAFYRCTRLTSVSIPNSVTSIGEEAFLDCSGLTSVTIPSSVTTIGHGVFDSCRSLTSVSIPNSVTSIDERAFALCTSLTSVTIPSSVTSIGSEAFRYNDSFTSVTVNATTPPTLGSNVFDRTNECPIYVPSASVNAYKTATNWSAYASRIQAIP